jgi:hypothetical protein
LENPVLETDYTKEAWVWGTLGTGIGMLVAGAFTGLEANERNDLLDSIEGDPTTHSQREFTDLQNEGAAWATATDLLLGGGILAVGLASYFLYRKGESRSPPARAGQVMGIGFTF